MKDFDPESIGSRRQQGRWRNQPDPRAHRIKQIDIRSRNSAVPHIAAQRHRQSEAMKAWVDSLGYQSLWRERGWPDLCRPLGEDDFECD